MTRPLLTPEPPRDAGDPAARDIQVMSRILMAGLLAVALIWPTEAVTGTLNPWNRGFYPALFCLLAGGLWVLRHRPQRAALAYLAITLGVNLFLVSSLLLALFTHANQTRYSPVLAATAWMPLGYAGAFMFLHRRVALAMSVVTFLATFVPITVGLLGGWLSHWGSDFPPLVLNMALAHGIYVLVQYGIGGMRMRYLRTRERVKVMHEMATTDMLTGLPNRREMSRVLNAQLGLARRGSLQLTVILIDVDHFKQINDQHGHAAGDAALVQLGQLLVSGLRDSDRLGRWGGEEFLLITPGVTLHGAVELAERLRSAVAGAAFAHPSPVTLSLGISTFRDGDTASSLLHRADTALYRAKQSGRNRVMCGPDEPTGRDEAASAQPA